MGYRLDQDRLMPMEGLDLRNGSAVAMGLSAAVAGMSIWIFKKNKYLS